MFNHVSKDQTVDDFGRQPGDLDYRVLREKNTDPERLAPVTLFKSSGKYYTSELWCIPVGAIGPHDMVDSPDFRRIDGGQVLVQSELTLGNGQDQGYTWGFPALL